MKKLHIGIIFSGFILLLLSLVFVGKKEVMANHLNPGCANASYLEPAANATVTKNKGEKLAVRIQAPCATRVDIFDEYTNTSKIADKDGDIFKRDLDLSSVVENKPVKLKATVQYRTSAGTYYNEDPTSNANLLRQIALTVKEVSQEPPTTDPGTSPPIVPEDPICPTPAFVSPASGKISNIVTVRTTREPVHTGLTFNVFPTGKTTSYEHKQLFTGDSWAFDTRAYPDGNYRITVVASCMAGYQPASGTQFVDVSFDNPQTSPGNQIIIENRTGTQPSSGLYNRNISPDIIVITTPNGVKIEVNAALLSIPIYREIVATSPRALLEIKEVKIDYPDRKEKDKNKIVLSGRAEPDTKYVLHVFSDPRELSVQTDKNGNWSVELESLEPGNHEAYLVLNDGSNKPKERSNVIAFVVPTAEAVAAGGGTQVPNSSRQITIYIIYAIVIVLAAIGVFMLYETVRAKLSKNKSVPPTGL